MADRKKPQSGKKVEDALVVPIEWHTSDQVVTRYANQTTVQFGVNECYVSFYETVPPLLVGTPEQIQAKTAELKSVRAECVSRVVVPRDFVPELIQVLQATWEKHRQKVGMSEDAEENKRKVANQ